MSGMNRTLLVVLAVPLLLFGPETTHAGPIYKSYDRDGKPIYSSSPPSKAGARHELPEIMKESPSGTLAKTALGQCTPHGGLDCSSGPDVDGSVVCLDGFRDARALFKYSCPTAKLVIVQLVQPPESLSVTVVVRNMRDTTAESPSFRLLSPTGRILDAKGPTSLAGHGIAVYDVYIPRGSLPGGGRSPTRNQLLITCANCG
jgi:hypothetical protein